MFKIAINIELHVSEEDINDIMCTALEGGITYWCDSVKILGDPLGKYAHEQIAKGGTLYLHDSDDGSIYELTRDKLLNGIKLAYKNNYYPQYGWTNGHTLDTCEIDAEVADTIIQLALFEDIMYG